METHELPVSPPVRELVQAAQEQMRIDFERKTRQIPHAGERGAAREDVLRSFLADHLPERFGVDTGFIIDAARAVSRQMDVVIFDKLSAPVFRTSAQRRLFPVEAVAGAISVKSRLDANELDEATQNLASAASLGRFAGDRRDVVAGGVPIPFEHAGGEPVFTAIFAYQSVELATLAQLIHAANQTLEPSLRVQLVGVLGQGIITYLLHGVLEPTYDPGATVGLVSEPDLALPLFYSFLAAGITRKIPVWFSYRSYLGLEVVPTYWVE